MTKARDLDSVPYDYDWVTTRSRCNPKDLFDKLRKAIQENVYIASSVSKCQSTLNKLDDNIFTVVTKGSDGYLKGFITFELNGSDIIATKGNSHEIILTAQVHLQSNGDCMFEVDGKPLQLWQLSRKVLEDVFF